MRAAIAREHREANGAFRWESCPMWSNGNCSGTLESRETSAHPLRERQKPFDGPDWLFEIKYDGYRGLLYLERGRGRLSKAAALRGTRGSHATKCSPKRCGF